MAENAFFDSVAEVDKTCKFFINLTDKLAKENVKQGEDVKTRARALKLRVPSTLSGSSIVISDGVVTKSASPRGQRSLSFNDVSPSRIVIRYPPGVYTGTETTNFKVKKCYRVCKNVNGAKVCAEVCVDINVSFGGISGKISATVTVAF